jgi:hypothetical protein
MDSRTYYVDKSNNTSADTLLAIGFASLVSDIHRKLYETTQGILIEDAGPYYMISLPNPVDASNLPDLSGMPLLLTLDSTKEREKQGKRGRPSDGFPYDTQIEKSRAYRERVKTLPADLQTPDARIRRAPELVEMIGDEPDPRLGHYQAINQMKIASSFNELAWQWIGLTEEQRRLLVSLLLDLFSRPGNDIQAAIVTWQKLTKEHGMPGKILVSALQIVNPTTGKGANRGKASELAIGNQDSFWPLELLKFRGFMDAAAPLVIKESKDRKTYVLQPKIIELHLLQYMMQEFRAAFWPTTAVKLDILASLRFAQVFVKQYRELFQRSRILSRRKQKVTSLAQGFEATSYKDMGSAYATMNLATIGLPMWLPPIETAEDLEEVGMLLDEHIRLVLQIRNAKGEEGSEEFELLRFYRDFLSGDDLRPFWKFTTASSSYLISAREKNRHVQQLTTHGLENLLMDKQQDGIKLAEIIENTGFQNIAEAIREATVNAQYRRAQQGDRTTYEVRYGLGHELMRKARYRGEFMKALSEFLHEYNNETAREEEKLATRLKRKIESADRREYKLRRSVSSEDMEEAVKLIDRFGSELVGSMLVAYGYTFDSRKVKRATDAPGTMEATSVV